MSTTPNEIDPIPDPEEWKILGHRSDGAYLLVPEGVDVIEGRVKARILLENGSLYPEQFGLSIFAHTTFDRYNGPQDILPALLADATPVDFTGAPHPDDGTD